MHAFSDVHCFFFLQSDDFWKEARALHAISRQAHPNVLRFFGVCNLGEQMALITEFMIHGSLKQYLIKNATQITPRLLLHFARSASAGMLHLSSMTPPVLHRTQRKSIYLQYAIVCDFWFRVRI